MSGRHIAGEGAKMLSCQHTAAVRRGTVLLAPSRVLLSRVK
jgi:hypothetical protein